MASVHPTGEASFTTAGSFTWTAPTDVVKVSVVCVGGGGTGGNSSGGAGGGLAWRNNITVSPGTGYTIVVGQYSTAQTTQFGGSSSAFGTIATGGQCGQYLTTQYTNHTLPAPGGPSGTYDGGGVGGTCLGGPGKNFTNNLGPEATAGGGGAAGYTGDGGAGAGAEVRNTWGNTPNVDYKYEGQYTRDALNGAGGGGGGGGSRRTSQTYSPYAGGMGGGGVGLLGEAASGIGGNTDRAAASSDLNPICVAGGGGSGGERGGISISRTGNTNGRGTGGLYGGGGGSMSAGVGGRGAVRIMWGPGRSFPRRAST